MGVVENCVGERESRCPYFRDVIRGNCTGSLIIWVGDVGGSPIHWEDFVRLPP